MRAVIIKQSITKLRDIILKDFNKNFNASPCQSHVHTSKHHNKLFSCQPTATQSQRK